MEGEACSNRAVEDAAGKKMQVVREQCIRIRDVEIAQGYVERGNRHVLSALDDRVTVVIEIAAGQEDQIIRTAIRSGRAGDVQVSSQLEVTRAVQSADKERSSNY